MFEIQVFVPTVGNDGRAFGSAEFTAFEAELIARFGGFSLLPGSVSGGWRGEDGRVYTDTLRVYVVWAASIADGVKAVEVARVARVIFSQEAVSIRYLGLAEIVS